MSNIKKRITLFLTKIIPSQASEWDIVEGISNNISFFTFLRHIQRDNIEVIQIILVRVEKTAGQQLAVAFRVGPLDDALLIIVF